MKTRVPLTYHERKTSPGDDDASGAPGVWFGRWEERKVYLRVAGDAAAPYPRHADTLWKLVDHFDEMTRSIEAYAAGLSPDACIAFSHKPQEAFAADVCGFDTGGFDYLSITVMAVDPTRAAVAFVTGEPDGYVTFTVTLDAGRPVEIVASIS